MNKYLVHYHIYKNAGSSVDKAIRNTCGFEGLLELDKDPRYKNHNVFDEKLVNSIIAEGSEYVAFSAHKMTPTFHLSKRHKFIPIVHVRHPLLRAASVYRYEKKRLDEKPGKEYATQLEFPEWLDWSLAHDNYLESRNYQTTLLSIPDVSQGDDMSVKLSLERVKERLETIPVVGVVEYFDESCRYYESYIGDYFPGFRFSGAHANKTKDVKNWKDELEELQGLMPRETLLLFKERNQCDYDLFFHCVQRLGKSD